MLQPKKESSSKLQLVKVNQLDVRDQQPKFNNQRSGFSNSIQKLNWILQYPWIIEKLRKDELEKKYYFTSSAKSFLNHAYLIQNQDHQTVGMAMITLRDGHLKIPYLWLNESIEVFIPLLINLLLHYRVKTFTCFHKSLNNALSTNKIGLYRKEIQRKIMVSKKMSSLINFDDINANDGDGDAAFT
jgi:hypothetical protein